MTPSNHAILQCIISFADGRCDQAELDAALMSLLRHGSSHVAIVSSTQLACVLQLYLAGAIDADALEQWAQLLEIRAEFDISAIEDFLYALANPAEMGGINPQTIHRMLDLLP